MMSGFLGTDEKATEENMKKISKEVSKIKGYNIATYIKWEHESDSIKKQREEAEKTEAREEEEEDEDVDVSQGVGGFLSGVAKKAANKKLKEEKKKREAEKKEKNKGQENVVFESYTEIKKVSTSKIDESEFTVPAGYKLVK